MKTLQLITITLLVLLTGCSSNPVNTIDNKNIAFYVQTNADAPSAYETRDNWALKTEIVRKDDKEKAFIYNFTVTSPSQKYSVSDINYKYGSYGKWRIIEKNSHITLDTKPDNTIVIHEFPITIKKSGDPHNQLLRVSLKSENNETKYINLVFGIQKCISKTEKEFVCF